MTALIDDLIREKVENERKLVAAAVALSAVTAETASWIGPEMFTNREYQAFWRRFEDHGDGLRACNEVGLDATIFTEMARSFDFMARADEFARVVANLDYLIHTVEGCQKIALEVSKGKPPIEVQQLCSRLAEAMPIMSSKAVMPEMLHAEFNDLLVSGDPGMATGIVELDGASGGLFAGELTILAARPGMGKTAMALEWARYIASCGTRVVFFSLEMPRVQLWARMACGEAGITWEKVRTGSLTMDELAHLQAASAKLQDSLGDNFIVEDQIWTVGEIHQSVAYYRPQVVVVDHLGEISWGDSEEKEVVWMGRATKYLRHHVARSLKTALVLVHQLSRSVEARQDKRPILSDLRWSGEIEQLADQVVMLYREDYYAEPIKGLFKVPLEIWLRKYRQGTSNQMHMVMYNLKTQRFEPIPEKRTLHV